MENQKRTCLICGITDRRTFMFPQGSSTEEKLRFEAWLKFAMKSNPPEERLKMKCKRLCIIHFEDKYITDPFRLNKVRNALPTLLEGSSDKNLSQESSKKRPPKEDLKNSIDIAEVLQDHSDLNLSHSSESQTLLRENSINTLPRSNFPQTLKVIGDRKMNDPSIIKTILDKVRLKKKGSVFVLPLKKKCNLQKLTRDRLEHLIESMPTEDLNLKNRILKILRGKISYKYLNTNGKGTLGKVKHCTCTQHCKSNTLFPHIGVKIDGWNANKTSPEIMNNSKQVFTVSSLLSNIQDKVQIERLCQLVIESLYRLKKVNESGAISKLEIFLYRDEITSALDRNEVTSEPLNEIKTTNETAQINPVATQVTPEIISEKNIVSEELSPQSEISSQCPQSEIPISSPPESSKTLVNPSVHSKQHITVNLNSFHDHNYLSLDSQVLFEKAPYIVKLIDSDTFKSSSKKTRIFKRPSIETNRKMQQEYIKLRSQVGRLRKLLKKKNDHFQVMKEKVKYLADVVRKEKGLKRIRYPRYIGSSDSEPLLKNESSISESEVPEAKRNSKKKPILIQSLELPPFDIKPPEVNLNESLDYFYDSFLEDCIEEG